MGALVAGEHPSTSALAPRVMTGWHRSVQAILGVGPGLPGVGPGLVPVIVPAAAQRPFPGPDRHADRASVPAKNFPGFFEPGTRTGPIPGVPFAMVDPVSRPSRLPRHRRNPALVPSAAQGVPQGVGQVVPRVSCAGCHADFPGWMSGRVYLRSYVIPEGALDVKSLGVAESVCVVVGGGRGTGPAARSAGGGSWFSSC